MRTIILILIILSMTIAYSTTITLTNIAQVGGTDTVRVIKYSIRVTAVSLEVSGNNFNNQINSITISVASSRPGYYNVYATITSGTCSASASWLNVYLSSTPTSLSSSLSPRCSYTTSGASVEVRGVAV